MYMKYSVVHAVLREVTAVSVVLTAGTWDTMQTVFVQNRFCEQQMVMFLSASQVPVMLHIV